MVELSLIFKSLMRERALFGLWIVSLCVAVTGLLVVDVYRQSLTYTLQLQGRKILTGDVTIASRKPLTEVDREDARKIFPAGTQYSELTEMFAMISTPKESRLASIRFVDDNYPLLGELEIQTPARVISEHGDQLRDKPEAWIASDFVTLLNLKIGDDVKVGNVTFKIAGLLHKDSSQTFRFGNMAPRIYVHRKFLESTGLVQFGSTFTQTIIALLQKPDPGIKKKLEARFMDPAVQITNPTDLEQGPFRVMGRLLDFLGLTGLVTLCLGWIGVYYLGRRWLMFEATPSGLLKSLGFSTVQLKRLLSRKLLLITMIGVISGGLFAWIVAIGLYPLVKDTLPSEFTLQWSWSSTLLLMVVGPLAGWLLLLPSLNVMAEEPPLKLVQGEVNAKLKIGSLLLFSLTTAALFFAVAFFQARSWKVTFTFFGALLGTVAAIAALSFLFLYLVRRVQNTRRGWRTHLTFALWARRRGLAVLMITVSAMAGLLSQLIPNIEKTLVSELRTPPSIERPALFLFDIQDDQLAPLQELLAEKQIAVSQTAPFVRARIIKVNDQDFERGQTNGWSTREEEVDARMRNRGINLSYHKDLSPSEKIIEGKPWTSIVTGEISVEKGYAERLHLNLNDKMRFDVQGVEMEAKIASIREITWDSFQPNFFIMFPPGVLDEAPKTWILTVKRTPKYTPAEIQSIINQKFPSVTSINVQEAIDNASDLFGKLGGGLRLASALCLGLGIFVFLMILLFQISAAQKDLAQLKCLGLRTRDLIGLQISTYGGLATIGNLLGALLSLTVAWALAHFAFNSKLQVDWLTMIEIFATSLFAAMFGLAIVSWRHARRASLTQALGVD